MPSEIMIQTWIWIARTYASLLTRMEQALIAQNLPPLAWYDVLVELERAGAAGLRQFALEDALLLKQYNVSRLVARIEKEGYLRRAPCQNDGRGKRLFLTQRGRKLRAEMWRIYGAMIEETIGRHLSEKEAVALIRPLRRLVRESQAAARVHSGSAKN